MPDKHTPNPETEPEKAPVASDVVDQTKGFKMKERGGPEKLKFKAAFVHAEGAIAAKARDIADAKMSRDKEEMKGVSGFFKKIWVHNIAREYYHQKELAAARRAIQESGNLYIGDEGSKKDHEEAMAAIVERFTSDYEGMISKEEVDGKRLEWKRVLGEIPENQSQQYDPALLAERQSYELSIKDQIKALVIDYAKGEMSAEAFQAQKTRILNESTGEQADVKKAAEYTDNLLQIAEQVKEKMGHQAGTDNLDFDLDIIIGKARAGVRTEAQLNTVDRLVESMKNSRWTSWIREDILGAAVASAYIVSTKFARGVATNRAVAYTTFGASAAIAGGLAYARERVRYTEDWRQHMREMAEGKSYNTADAARRSKMEQFRYGTESANGMTQELNDYMAKLRSGEVKPEDITAALGRLSETRARLRLSDSRLIDLISFSDPIKVEQERTALREACGRVEEQLKQTILVTGYKGPETGAPDTGVFAFDERMNKLRENQEDLLVNGAEGIEAKYKALKAARHRSARKKGWMTFAIALTVGAGIQEARAYFDPGQTGVFDHDVAGAHRTIAGSIRDLFEGHADHHVGAVAGGGGIFARFHEWHLPGTNLRTQLPEGYDLRPSAGGTFQLFHGKVVVEGGIRFEANGTLSHKSIELLGKHGFKITSHETLVADSATKSVDVSAEEYAKNHPELFHRVKYDGWYDNDTPAPKFDHGELQLRWGGPGGSGIDGHNAVFDVSHMRPGEGGSWHEGFGEANAPELIKHGTLKLIMALGRSSQHYVHEVPIVNGHPMIDMNSPVGKLFFEAINGKNHAHGLIQVAEVRPSSDGIEHVRILATYVGKSKDVVPDTVNVGGSHKVITNIFNLKAEGRGVVSGDGYEVVSLPTVGVWGRTPLERVKRGTPGEIPKYEEKELEQPPYTPIPVNESLVPREFIPQERSYLRILEDTEGFLAAFEAYFDNNYSRDYHELCQELPEGPLRRKYENDFRQYATDYGEARMLLNGIIEDKKNDRPKEEIQEKAKKLFTLIESMRLGMQALRKEVELPLPYHQLVEGDISTDTHHFPDSEEDGSLGEGSDKPGAKEDLDDEKETWTRKEAEKYDGFIKEGVKSKERNKMRRVIRDNPQEGLGMLKYFRRYERQAYAEARASLSGDPERLATLDGIHQRRIETYDTAKGILIELAALPPDQRVRSDFSEDIGRVVAMTAGFYEDAQSYREEVAAAEEAAKTEEAET